MHYKEIDTGWLIKKQINNRYVFKVTNAVNIHMYWLTHYKCTYFIQEMYNIYLHIKEWSKVCLKKKLFELLKKDCCNLHFNRTFFLDINRLAPFVFWWIHFTPLWEFLAGFSLKYPQPWQFLFPEIVSEILFSK